MRWKLQSRKAGRLAIHNDLGYNQENPLQEDYPRENENIMEMEEEVSILTLTDENGNDVNFEYLDCIEYQGKEYLVLLPEEEDAAELVILEVEPVDEEVENYLAVEDEAVLEAVYGIFKEKYKDIMDFAD